MNWIMKTALGFGLCVWAGTALAGDAKVGSIEIHDAWSRATPPKAAAGGAFMTVMNTGSAPDSLKAARSDVAKTVELHAHIKDGEVMRMAPVADIAVPPGGAVALAPGGFHVMLIGLKAPLAEGASFPLELEFAQAGKVTVMVDVKAIGAMGSGMRHDPVMHERHMKDPAHRPVHEQMHGKQ
jgi:copper(I)-binding protein